MDRDQSKRRTVIFQTPNIPLVVWFVCMVISHAFREGVVHTVFATVGFIAIVIWALWEIVSGVNIFRRLLGLAVLIFVLVGRF